MSDSAIDRAILSVVGENWSKVAMVVVKVAGKMGADFPAGEEGFKLIAERIGILVTGSRLVARGDIANWRFSEVRLPDKTST